MCCCCAEAAVDPALWPLLLVAALLFIVTAGHVNLQAMAMDLMWSAAAVSGGVILLVIAAVVLVKAAHRGMGSRNMLIKVHDRRPLPPPQRIFIPSTRGPAIEQPRRRTPPVQTQRKTDRRDG